MKYLYKPTGAAVESDAVLNPNFFQLVTEETAKKEKTKTVAAVRTTGTRRKTSTVKKSR